MNLRICLAGLAALMWLAPSGAFADVILDWNEIALAQVVKAQQGAQVGSRTMAIVHLAMFDAVNAVECGYAPYAFQGANRDASPEVAAASAAHRTLMALLPAAQLPEVEEAFTAALLQYPNDASKQAGIELGEQAGDACVLARKDDGTGAPNTYRPRTKPGVYIPTALPAASEWPYVKPFMLEDAAQFRPAPPPALASDVWARDYEEIRTLGGKQSTARTAEQTETAQFWSVVGPPAYNPVVRALAVANPASLLDNARLFAIVNMAAVDAFIAVFDAKYAYEFWRPITAIRNGDFDENEATLVEPAWVPLIDTPMHPEYPCAHCIASASVAAVLEASFGSGEVAPISMTSAATPGVTHTWTRLTDYAEEVRNARIWAGVHYRNSTEVGASMGKRIGDLVARNALRPAVGCSSSR